MAAGTLTAAAGLAVPTATPAVTRLQPALPGHGDGFETRVRFERCEHHRDVVSDRRRGEPELTRESHATTRQSISVA
jgi:hypothetical protein